MTLSSLLDSRHSCRAFLSKEVPAETISELFTLAQRTPSWCNTQPWQVYITSGSALTQFAEALSAHAASQAPVSDLPLPASYSGVLGDRRRESGYGLYSALGIDRSDREGRSAQAMRNFNFFGAPHTAVITAAAELGVYGAVDCGAYVSMLLLAAEELGLAAVAQAAIAFHSDLVHSQLGIPKEQNIVCTVSFGYSDDLNPVNHFRTTRADVQDAIHHITGPDAS